MDDLNWLLFVGGLIVGFVMCYSICDMIFPISKDTNNEDL